MFYKTDSCLGFLQQGNKQAWHESDTVKVVSVKTWKGCRAGRRWGVWVVFHGWTDGRAERWVSHHGRAFSALDFQNKYNFSANTVEINEHVSIALNYTNCTGKYVN